jgi:hypothetical protein
LLPSMAALWWSAGSCSGPLRYSARPRSDLIPAIRRLTHASNALTVLPAGGGIPPVWGTIRKTGEWLKVR